MNGNVVASDGKILDLDSLPQALAYNVDGTLATVTVVSYGVTYVQTLTYTSGKITHQSQFVPQP